MKFNFTYIHYNCVLLYFHYFGKVHVVPEICAIEELCIEIKFDENFFVILSESKKNITQPCELDLCRTLLSLKRL